MSSLSVSGSFVLSNYHFSLLNPFETIPVDASKSLALQNLCKINRLLRLWFGSVRISFPIANFLSVNSHKSPFLTKQLRTPPSTANHLILFFVSFRAMYICNTTWCYLSSLGTALFRLCLPRTAHTSLIDNAASKTETILSTMNVSITFAFDFVSEKHILSVWRDSLDSFVILSVRRLQWRSQRALNTHCDASGVGCCRMHSIRLEYSGERLCEPWL